MTFLDTIRMEMNELNLMSLLEPEDKLRPKEQVVGEMDEELKRLYGLVVRYRENAEDYVIKAQCAPSHELVEQYTRDGQESRKKFEVLSGIFWTSIKDTFKLWGKAGVGVRKGWQVVWYEAEPDMPAISIMAIAIPL